MSGNNNHGQQGNQGNRGTNPQQARTQQGGNPQGGNLQRPQQQPGQNRPTTAPQGGHGTPQKTGGIPNSSNQKQKWNEQK